MFGKQAAAGVPEVLQDLARGRPATLGERVSSHSVNGRTRVDRVRPARTHTASQGARADRSFSSGWPFPRINDPVDDRVEALLVQGVGAGEATMH